MKFLARYLVILLSFSSLKVLAHTDLAESLIKEGDYYVGGVFGKHDYKNHANVKIKSFYIMQTEVSYEFYQQIYLWGQNNHYLFNPGCNGATYEDCRAPEYEQGKHPVTNVAWGDAVIFANALSALQHLQPVYLTNKGAVARNSEETDDLHEDSSANGYRLPNITEWQIAARGGEKALAKGHYGQRFSGSDKADEVAWYPPFNTKNFGTARVGSLKPDDAGIYDMSGNVYEWVNDKSDAEGVTMHYFCGGSYIAHSTSLASCDSHSATFTMSDIGFRLIRKGGNE
ncbi:SUMF1/EgtB/PvdO family nonheme iron enzyme [Erwinia sp.]|uniref:SUMF1/EgtB/PvdO family nonheme iron enzyme n=1 Tax=Erwinia citreus TaxID=558 RepID=UPI0028A253DF|nr:SUMF1/EgtB/PvdO family nonheme iron enzyme [Erwinia sp.]